MYILFSQDLIKINFYEIFGRFKKRLGTTGLGYLQKKGHHLSLAVANYAVCDQIDWTEVALSRKL